MKLSEIIDRVDTSDRNSSYVDSSSIAEEMGISCWGITDCNRLASYWYTAWYCTDTWVGGLIYFLDGQPVAVSYKSGRKSSENFKWLSDKTYADTKQYIMSLITDEEDSTEYVDLDEELGEGTGRAYNSMLLEDHVIYDGILRKVVDKTHDLCATRIKLESIGWVDVTLCIVPYRLNK